jgi:hypothetical protein
LQEGLNPPSWNMLHFHGSYLGLVVKTGLVTGIISLTVSFCFTFLQLFSTIYSVCAAKLDSGFFKLKRATMDRADLPCNYISYLLD